MLESLMARWGEMWTVTLAGAAIGLLFGFFAHRARFCLRSAVIEFSRGTREGKLTVWLFTFSTAVLLTQAFIQFGGLDVSGARQLAGRGSLSGAVIGGMMFGAVWLAAALVWARRQRVRFWSWFGAIGVGVMVACAWLATWAISRQAFDLVVPVQSLSFTGPAADTLMLVLSPPGQPLKFDLGLVPGVAVGAFLSALRWHELKLEGFQGGQAMRRYIVGAMLMGFGGMLAGGCAVGAGVSGAAVFTLTSWVTLTAMWGAAMLTDRLVDLPKEAGQPVPPMSPHGDPELSASYARP